MSEPQTQDDNQEVQQISIEVLQLSLEVYEIQSQQKLKKLQTLFSDKKSVDPNKMFYEERSSLQIKFQNIISDLTQFLINQQIASTDKLRKIFFRLLENPLIFLFKVSRFEIFNLRLNAFDIQLQPIDAILELGSSILTNIQRYHLILEKVKGKDNSNGYESYENFLYEAQRKLIQDQIFLFYSYLRKGGNIIKKKFEDKVRVVELYGKIEQQLLKKCIVQLDAKTLKQLSILNYQLYLLEHSFDVLCFYLKVPFKAEFSQTFKELETLGTKAKQSSNFDLFILIFLRYSKEILAKIQTQGIDPLYSNYIENILTSLLELWGCRLCYFQQFFQVFQKLLNLHPKRHVAIQICLKHSPKLQKDDIVLLRTHFKHQLLEKHSSLLSLLKKKTIEEINGSLSDLYHRTLYNLDFKTFSREEILNLLTVLNGNSSLGEFFGIVERALKQWNHTIDLAYSHKYIESQFKFPKIDRSKIIQSIALFNNLCLLQEKGFQDFQQLIKAGTIQKTLLDLSSFLFKNEQCCKLLQQVELLKIFLNNILQFENRTSGVNTNWQNICQIFTNNLIVFGQKYASSVIQTILSITSTHFQSFTIKSLVTVYRNIILAQQHLKLLYLSTLQSITNILLSGISSKNQAIKLFRLIDRNINDNLLLSSDQQSFLRKNGVLNGDIIESKDTGCFVLSELELITNPVQFDKVMDNYYFTLDSNSKKYIQYLVGQWVNYITNKQDKIASIYLLLMKTLIKTYPIALPLFCTTRIILSNNITKRFIEVLVSNLTAQSYQICKQILECRCIRFKNGRDYIKQQIAPLILKQTIKLINEQSANINHFQLLAQTLKISKNTDIKIDLIQKAIQIINYKISQSKQSQIIYRLSLSHNQLLSKFFQKKQIDMRKKGLQKTYVQLALSEVKTKISALQTEDNKKQVKKVQVSQQIMITPYAISQEFNAQQSKLEKVKLNKIEQNNRNIELQSLKKILPSKPIISGLINQKVVQNYKTIDLSKLKYNIQCHLGSQLKTFCLKQGFKIITNKNQQGEISETNEQNITLVQYYLKQFTNPELSSEIILDYIQALINQKVQYSSLFTNYSNFQKLFFGLILILRYACSNHPQPNSQKTLTDRILNIPTDSRTKIAVNIIKVFSKIGYNNLWAQNYNSISNLSYYKQLKQKSGFKQQSADESFFSWILKLCLQKQQLKQNLNIFLQNTFSSRPKDQNSLMYKVSIDRGLLNLIMKSLQIQNLSYLSMFFHSNFNNLRLYTDQLHEGLKALGMASKNRAYNQYVQLSKDIQDEEFFLPMKLFKQNFSFFIRIEKQGYKFKRGEQQKLGRERILKVIRSGANGQSLNKQIQKVIQEFQEELQKLQYNIASRVKSFYLATKLRDLSYQNSLTICLIHQILAQKKQSTQQILKKIKQIQLFSLMSQLHNELIRFGRNYSSQFLIEDRSIAQKYVSICSTRRYSHSINKVYQRCELQFDEVFQRCIDVLRIFFVSFEGRQWLNELNIYPPFLIKSFINTASGQILINNILQINSKYLKQNSINKIFQTDDHTFSNLLKNLREINKIQLLKKDNIKINYKSIQFNISNFLTPFKDQLIKSQTLSKSKDGYLLFNKYKTSQKTLEEIEILGIIIGYCIYHKIEIDLPLHSSLLHASTFGVCDLDDLLDIDFKVWEDLRNVMSTNESKDLNLNFSYIFQSLESLKPQRIELIDKGTSKKVNNLNRQQYCDAVCCYLLYKIVSKQINRFLQALLYTCPKQILSTFPISQFLSIFLKKNPKYLSEILKRIYKRRGLILPPSVIVKEKRYENTFDYQSIQWFNEILQGQAQLKQKIWPNQSNLFICTWMGQGLSNDINSRTITIGRFNSKIQLQQALLKSI